MRREGRKKEAATAYRAALAIENARLYRRAQRAIEARDGVLGVVAHDLRSPLTAILMVVARLRRTRLDAESHSQVVDGIERVVGERKPGDVFGEVPIALGTVFPVGFRAAEPSRVMRIEARDYHAVAAEVPDIAKEVGRLAAHRMSGSRGLQGIAAEPPPPRAIVVGHRWDASCTELRRFLDRNQVTYEWLTPDRRGAAERWEGQLPLDEDLPAIRVVGGKTVIPRGSPATRSVLVTNVPTRPGCPVRGIERPLSAGWFLMLSGVSPCTACHTISPLLRSMALMRPYGGLTSGSPRTFKPPPPPPSPSAAAAAGVPPTVA